MNGPPYFLHCIMLVLLVLNANVLWLRYFHFSPENLFSFTLSFLASCLFGLFTTTTTTAAAAAASATSIATVLLLLRRHKWLLLLWFPVLHSLDRFFVLPTCTGFAWTSWASTMNILFCPFSAIGVPVYVCDSPKRESLMDDDKIVILKYIYGRRLRTCSLGATDSHRSHSHTHTSYMHLAQA